MNNIHIHIYFYGSVSEDAVTEENEALKRVNNLVKTHISKHNTEVKGSINDMEFLHQLNEYYPIKTSAAHSKLKFMTVLESGERQMYRNTQFSKRVMHEELFRTIKHKIDHCQNPAVIPPRRKSVLA
jgi:hypothetical protein